MPEFRTVKAGEVSLRCAIEGSGPLVVMVHGFPESWYSWRHQIGPVAEAGFTACAIDVRGYGGSDKPHPVDAYSMQHITGDVAALVEALAPGEKAILVGHDWGAPIVWNTALTRPDRIKAVAGLSVPYTGIPTRSFREVFEAVFTSQGKFFYQAYFQEPGVAEAELEKDVRDSLRRFYYAISGEGASNWPNDKAHGDPLLKGLPDPDPFPAWLTPADLDYFVGEFEASGFRGPLNRYRNHDADFAWLQGFKGRKIEQPSLFIGGERDLVLSMLGRGDLVAMMKAEMTDLRGADVLPGCGHWTQQERPAEVNARLIPWLRSV
ncbi:alpha/beta fold hydrolase [Caulobacter sp. KR2-114]|uniref:alpha/beta fold hydrolase n=1 Tax=Caulobacter sp. KR2-114 TaxID=3400912 RepID=UPI003C07080E